MSPAITATRTRTLGCCVACLLAQRHEACDTSLPVVQRSSIIAPVPAPRRMPDPLIPGYGDTDHYPAI